MVKCGGSTSVSAWRQEYGPLIINELGQAQPRRGQRPGAIENKTPAGDNDGGRKVKGIREDAE